MVQKKLSRPQQTQFMQQSFPNLEILEAMEEAFPMNGGDGAYSYSKNSQYQKQASDSVKGMIQEAVSDKLDLEKLLSISSTFSIADLGCSVGPNTFSSVQNLIEALQNKCSSQSHKNVEFQVFFNDHSANDFYTLFASLPVDRQYHAAGAPGSFHGRLFPRASITVAHSSYALQWLSKQPEGLVNEGRIHYAGASARVVKAYWDQFETDMGVFLSARAEEIVRGGLMFLIMPAIPDGVPLSDLPAGVLINHLGCSLMDLANEGVVDKAKIDAFNLPIYDPTVGEMRKVIEKNGWFSIERVELTNPLLQVALPINVDRLMMQLRAATEGVLTASFGNFVVEKMFENMLSKAEEIVGALEAGYHHSCQLFLVLKRK